MISQKQLDEQMRILAACEALKDKAAMAFRVAEVDKATRPLATRQSRYVVACLALTYFFREIGQQETSNNFQVLGEALQLSRRTHTSRLRE